jgi:hypothetical protein
MTPDQVTLQHILDLGYERTGPNRQLEFVFAYRHPTLPVFVYLNKADDKFSYIDYGTRDPKHDNSSSKIDYLSLDLSLPTIGEYTSHPNQSAIKDYQPSTALFSLWYCGMMAELERILGEPYDGSF